jgi:hypothetical protein
MLIHELLRLVSEPISSWTIKSCDQALIVDELEEVLWGVNLVRSIRGFAYLRIMEILGPNLHPSPDWRTLSVRSQRNGVEPPQDLVSGVGLHEDSINIPEASVQGNALAAVTGASDSPNNDDPLI